MSEPSIRELEALRDRLYAELSAVGDFRRGSVSENWRKCGKPNCACAAPDHPGHGPRFLWTRSEGRRKRVGRQLAAAEIEKVRREIARHAEFTAAVGRIVEVNEQIREARPAAGSAAGGGSSSPCAAPRPAASGKPSATTVTTRQEPPDVPTPEDDLGYLQN
jgi:uncharacterized protein DUF6788